MKIAFLTARNSVHVPVKTKYFVAKGYDVYYIGVGKQSNISISTTGVTNINVETRYKNIILDIIYKIIKVRQIVREHQIDVLHTIIMNYAIFSFLSGAKVKVYENNGSDVIIDAQKSLAKRMLYRFLYLFSDVVVQDSSVAQDAGIKCGASTRNNEIIELGIDFTLFNRDVQKGVIRERFGFDANDFVVFSPRSFTHLYNIDVIIKSIPVAKKCAEGKGKKIRFVFCNHFQSDRKELLEYNKYLNSLINELGVLSDVTLTGYIEEKDMPYFFADADLVVSVPSSDSSPRSVYEAMACMTPVIVSDLPWLDGKFEKGREIHVVPVRDVGCTAQAIMNAIGKGNPLNLAAAYQNVYDNINMMTHSKRLEKLYEAALDENGSGKVPTK